MTLFTTIQMVDTGMNRQTHGSNMKTWTGWIYKGDNMKLTKQEYESLVDSRLVDLERSLQDFKEYRPVVNDNDNLSAIKNLVMYAEKLQDAYESYMEAEEQEQIDEVEAENKICGIDMTTGLDEALNIRKER